MADGSSARGEVRGEGGGRRPRGAAGDAKIKIRPGGAGRLDAEDERARRAGGHARQEGAEGDRDYVRRHSGHFAGGGARTGPQLSGETGGTADAADTGVRIGGEEIKG